MPRKQREGHTVGFFLRMQSPCRSRAAKQGGGGNLCGMNQKVYIEIKDSVGLVLCYTLRPTWPRGYQMYLRMSTVKQTDTFLVEKGMCGLVVIRTGSLSKKIQYNADQVLYFEFESIVMEKTSGGKSPRK